MSQIHQRVPEHPGLATGRKTFMAWTIFSALAAWLGLAVAEGLAKEGCNQDGLAWNWKAWSCAQPGGILIIPPGLRRAGSD